MFLEIISEDKMKEFGQNLGSLLVGGEVIELVGDVGAGKTTLVKGIAVGLGIGEYVQSPSFTISRVYQGRDGIKLSHYDFYRLDDAGVMADELSETIGDNKAVTIIEWAGVVQGVLPADRLTVEIVPLTDDSRRVEIKSGGDISSKLLENLQV